MQEIPRNLELLQIPEYIDLDTLFRLLIDSFPPDDPVRLENQGGFTFKTRSYQLPNGESFLPKLESNEIQRRLELICQILNDLGRRHEGRPVYDLSQVYEAYAVIAANFLSIHGCFGKDGNGRATIFLHHLTLFRGGYNGEYQKDQFYDPITGDFAFERARWAIVLLNFHLLAGAKVLAARLELNHGDVSEILRNPQIITDRRTRLSATVHALSVICQNNSRKLTHRRTQNHQK